MAKQWVQLLYTVSLLLASVGCADAGNVTPLLGQNDLTQAEKVRAVLQTEASTAQKARADEFYRQAQTLRETALKNQRSWGAVAKVFGESAVHYPTPLALLGYGEAILYDFGGWQTERKTKAVQQKQFERTQLLYQAALTANEFIPQLSSQQRDEIKRYQNCLNDYLSTGNSATDCAPLRWAGLAP